VLFSDGFYLDIEEIQTAHNFILDRVHKCEYPLGRGHYGMVYVQSGKAEYRFSTGERVNVADGDAFFLSPNTAYSIVTEKAFKHYTVNFDIRDSSSDIGALNKPYCLLNQNNTEKIETVFKELVDICQAKKAGYKMRAVGKLYELIALFYSGYTSDEDYSLSQRLLPAKEYIEKNFRKAITLEELAFLSNMSITNFRREWKRHYASSPMQYRDSIRLYYAKEYLNCGYYSIAEVAEKCGYDDVSYFIRFFRQKEGITPGEYKKSFLGKNL